MLPRILKHVLEAVGPAGDVDALDAALLRLVVGSGDVVAALESAPDHWGPQQLKRLATSLGDGCDAWAEAAEGMDVPELGVTFDERCAPVAVGGEVVRWCGGEAVRRCGGEGPHGRPLCNVWIRVAALAAYVHPAAAPCLGAAPQQRPVDAVSAVLRWLRVERNRGTLRSRLHVVRADPLPAPGAAAG
jgi:hypothetical protein